MRQRALALADELAATAPPTPARRCRRRTSPTRSSCCAGWPTSTSPSSATASTSWCTAATPDGEQLLEAVLGTGLGILRQDQTAPRALSSMTPEAHAKVLEKRLLIITKANSRATVHRSAYLDYIGFKIFDDDGEVIGERRFLGPVLHAPPTAPASATCRWSAARSPRCSTAPGLSPRSHSGKDLLQILETYPRDELFQIKTDDLYHAVIGVLRMAGRRQLRLFVRRDGYGRFISCLIYLPRDRFTTAEPAAHAGDPAARAQRRRASTTPPGSPSRCWRGCTSSCGPTRPTRPATIDTDAAGRGARRRDPALGRRLHPRCWTASSATSRPSTLFTRYADAFPEGYKDEHTPYEAFKDLAKLELLEEPGQLEMHLFRKNRDDNDVRFKVFRYGEPMVLSAVLPVLHSLGVRVADERPYEVDRADGTVYLYDFGLHAARPGHRELAEVRPHVENAFAAAWRGEAEVDGFNELVLRAGLTWRQVVVLRAYAKYLRQAGTVFSQDYMESTFVAYPEHRRAARGRCSRPASPRLRSSSDRASGSQRSEELVDEIGGGSTTWPASTRTGSCAPT